MSMEALDRTKHDIDIDATDPYVEFGLVLALRIAGDSSAEAEQILSELQSAHHSHPVAGLALRYF